MKACSVLRCCLSSSLVYSVPRLPIPKFSTKSGTQARKLHPACGFSFLGESFEYQVETKGEGD